MMVWKATTRKEEKVWRREVRVERWRGSGGGDGMARLETFDLGDLADYQQRL